jgi:protein involved in polysaccharide export with SLBB domain
LRVLSRFRGRYYFVPFVVLALLFHRAACISAQDLTVSGTPQQANERIKSMGETSKSSNHEYTIGNGDLLDISVFDVPELTREVRVSQSGAISIPLVPSRLHVSGLTELQVQQIIADVLEAQGLVSHPEVSVTVKEHRSRPITIVGAVTHPMVYEADHGVTLLEVLAEAGGIATDAGDTIIVTRPRAALFVPIANPEPIADSAPGAAVTPATPDADAVTANTTGAPGAADKGTPTAGPASSFPSQDQVPAGPPPASADAPGKAEASATPAGSAGNSTPDAGAHGQNIMTINLNQLLEAGDMQNNIPLQAGDVVTVPHAGIVYVLGSVARPGGFVLSNDRTQLTTLKILSLAGGLNKTAKSDKAVIIRKDSQGKETQVEVDLKKIVARKTEDLQMRASDILYVPDSTSKEVLYQSLQIAATVATSVAIYRVAYR